MELISSLKGIELFLYFAFFGETFKCSLLEFQRFEVVNFELLFKI